MSFDSYSVVFFIIFAGQGHDCPNLFIITENAITLDSQSESGIKMRIAVNKFIIKSKCNCATLYRSCIILNANRKTYNCSIIGKNTCITANTLIDETLNIIARFNINADFKVIVIFVNAHFVLTHGLLYYCIAVCGVIRVKAKKNLVTIYNAVTICIIFQWIGVVDVDLISIGQTIAICISFVRIGTQKVFFIVGEIIRVKILLIVRCTVIIRIL